VLRRGEVRRSGAERAAELAAIGRWLRGLPGFLRAPLTPDECRARIEANLRRRDENFLGIVERGVFAGRRSPYRALFEHAGLGLPELAALVGRAGLEGALRKLLHAGVYVTLEEFKGRTPIRRDGLELSVRPSDFDNPLVRPAQITSTGGSRGPRRSVLIDLDQKAQQAVYHAITLEALGIGDRPAAVWRPAPPGAAGLGIALAHAKLARPLERWFSQTPLTPRGGQVRDYFLALSTVAAGRAARCRVPMPEHVPLHEAVRVSRWLAEKRALGTPAHLSTTASSAVRACLAAREHGLDVSGTFFRLGGEPFTRAKARTIEKAGALAVGNYTMTEAGRVGIACSTPEALDDYHLCSDKLALVQHDRLLAGGARVPAFLFTTLLASTPKLMINVETDDYGTVVERSCGCLLGELGLTTHLHGVRSFEKLTSDGAAFLGSDVTQLVDEVLPARFGGAPTDYQLVEEEVGGLPRVSVIVRPRLGEIDEAAVVETVLSALAAGPSYKGMMAAMWRSGGVVRVVRREPYETVGAKVFPLHLLER
jgi:hypothetical protein